MFVNLTNGNLSNLRSAPLVSDLSLDLWFVVCLMSTILASFAVLLLLYIILSSERFRTGSGVYISHLLLNHFITCGLGQPIYAVSMYRSLKWEVDPIDCNSFLFIRRVVMAADMWASLFLAANRFNAVFCPHRYKWWTKKQVVVGVIVFSWVLGFASVTAPLIGVGGSFGKNPPFFVCYIRALPGFWSTFSALLGSYFPMLAIGALYICIAMHVAVQKLTGKHEKMDRKTRVAITLSVAYAFYFICYIPPTVMAFRYPTILLRVPLAFLGCQALQYIGNSGNPVIFFAMNSDYRAAAKRLIQGFKWSSIAPLKNRTLEAAEIAKH